MFLILGINRYGTEVTALNDKDIRPIAFTKCLENFHINVKFNGYQVTLRLRHNSNLPFQLVPTVLLESAGDIRWRHAKVVGIWRSRCCAKNVFM